MIKLTPDDIALIERTMNNPHVSETVIKGERKQPVILSVRRRKENK